MPTRWNSHHETRRFRRSFCRLQHHISTTQCQTFPLVVSSSHPRSCEPVDPGQTSSRSSRPMSWRTPVPRREERIRVLRNEPNAAPAHHTYLRLKVAVLLGLLDGRLGANDEDWELSGHIMDASDRRFESPLIHRYWLGPRIAHPSRGRRASTVAPGIQRVRSNPPVGQALG